MIYDCFTYFNTPEILKLRLAILADYVDCFVLVECATTFSGKPKPLYYAENPISGYKIRHIVTEAPYQNEVDETGAWRNTEAQLKGYGLGTFDAGPNDIVLLSDVDEIPRPSRLLVGNLEEAAIFEQDWYMYWLNYAHTPKHYGTTRIRYRPDTNWFSAGMYRWAPEKNIITDGGWHFSYFGGADIIREKLGGHHDAGLREVTDIERQITEGGVLSPFLRQWNLHAVEVDDTYPAPIVQHPEQWQGLFHPDHRKA